MQTMTVADLGLHSSGTRLAEREAPLAGLNHAFDEARSGRGRLVLVRGEAGIGKTALVEAFLDGLQPGIRVARGACDGFATPQPFAPLHDLVPVLGDDLRSMLDADTGHGAVARWVRDRLNRGGPWVVVIEDVQWADEATLELLLFLARRLEGTTVLVIATWRDDEASPATVERAIGALATIPTVRQLPLARLSRHGIAALAAGSRFDADEVARLTGGNPLFVHEVLRSTGELIPISIREAIRGRIAGLDGRGRRALDAAAIAGPQAEPWLVAALAGEDVLGIDDGIRDGLLMKREGIDFTHELTRMVVLDDMPVIHSIALHRMALATLRRAGSIDTARLAHHAEAAADAAATVEYAVAAGRRAYAMSALREALDQFRRALRFAGNLAAPERADLLERLAQVLYLRNEMPEAYAMGKEAVALRRGDDVRLLGLSLSRHAFIASLDGHMDESWAVAREGVELLEPFGPTPELGMGHVMLGRLALGAGRYDASKTASARAFEIGNEVDDAEVRAISLASLGTIALFQGDLQGYAQLEESLTIGRVAGLAEAVDRSLNNLGVCASNLRELRRAESYFTDLAEHGERSEIVRCSIHEPRAEIALALGQWDEAEDLARSGFGARDPVDPMLSRIILARLAVRRGADPEPWLIGPTALAAELDSPLVSWPLLTCRVEQAWLAGRLGELEAALGKVLDEAIDQGDPWSIGDFSRWLSRIGALPALDPRAALPYRLEISGDVAGAAAEWERLEMPYELAMCLADSDDLAHLRRAYTILSRWGVTALGTRVGERIRELGGQVPRGPRPSTRAHPDGLTSREAEIAGLVAEGRSNQEIADELHRSMKTAAHHVSAILAKLGLTRRSQVAAALGRTAAGGRIGRVGGGRPTAIGGGRSADSADQDRHVGSTRG